MPRRSSTRMRSTVSSPTRPAPGLNTELARYGSWSTVMIGLSGCRGEQVPAAARVTSGTPRRHGASARLGPPRGGVAAGDRSRRMCSTAVSHMSVDSAPWLRFTPCGSTGRRGSRPAPGSPPGCPRRCHPGTSRRRPRRRAVALVAGYVEGGPAARIVAVASIGCWSNGCGRRRGGHQPSLPIGEKMPSRAVWTAMSQSRTREARSREVVVAQPTPATIRARGRSAFS